jgi:prepilin-type N-terminal cleavage/methylation domain-containing protein
MTYNDVRKNENKGFSLVELIVVIAIMAVLTSVLAPSLLAYVERSRAQKDDSAMSEVVNAILLGLSDQDIYDEVLAFTTYNNVSCYADDDAGQTGSNAAKVTTKAARGTQNTELEQWYWDDNARLRDEDPYHFEGNMRGVTITFRPETNSAGDRMYDLRNGIVNWGLYTSAGTSTNGRGTETVTIPVPTDAKTEGTVDYFTADPDLTKYGCFGSMSGDQKNCYLYNRTRATVGDTIVLTSQTYRNSDYTIFIRMGSTGGAQADAQDAVAVYGQWNGTNLP